MNTKIFCCTGFLTVNDMFIFIYKSRLCVRTLHCFLRNECVHLLAPSVLNGSEIFIMLGVPIGGH